MDSLGNIKAADPAVAQVLGHELQRQRSTIELIASENFTSLAVMEACGSVLTNKYAEGYPGKRYYGGCEAVDEVEALAIERLCQLYGCKYANVQPHSGASANLTAYLSVLQAGDTYLGMSLAHGGHLTHGSPVNFSGQIYNVVGYGVNTTTEVIDYDDLAALAKLHRPKAIVAGASAYPRALDFAKFREIADSVGAVLIVDMAHIAGLVAGGVHETPVPYADIITSTSHKTLRGPRGGFIISNSEEFATKIDKANFPGSQGGPLEHVIAGKAVCFGEALQPEFKEYAKQVVANSAALAESLQVGGLRLVSGGTDNHLCLVDLTAAGITGKDAENLLETVGITVNKNTIPNETLSPFVASGVRIGTAAITTRGFKSEESALIGSTIARVIFNPHDEGVLTEARGTVSELLASHPLYPEL